MNVVNVEPLALGVVLRVLSRADKLYPFLNANDKEPVWDGYVAVYRSASHTNQNLLLRIPVQVKGQNGATDGAEIRYRVRLDDLRHFAKDNPTVFFVVRMDRDTERETVYYRAFPKEDAERLVSENGQQGTVALGFQRLPAAESAAASEIEALFLALAGGEVIAGRDEAVEQPPLSAADLFLYDAGVVGFYGREGELEQLNAFLDAPGAFRWWGVIGPGGAGKTRLAYEWGGSLQNAGWTVRHLKAGDYKKLDALAEQHPERLLLIADYARQQAAALGAWMETLCGTARENPVRLLLLERDEGIDAAGETPWEKELYSAGNELHLRRARHGKLLRLPALKPEARKRLIRAFAAALKKRDASLPALTEAGADMLLERLGEIDGECRPLYAMLLTDAFLRDGDAAHWTQEELLERLVLREAEQLKNAVRALRPQDARPDKTLLDAALRLRRLATALGASGDRALAELLALDGKLGETLEKKAEQYDLPSVEELLLYLGLLRYEGGRLLVPALRPDLLGEYALLHFLTACGGRARAAFYAAALQDWELDTFFQRLYADYAPLLNDQLEHWEKLLPGGLPLDDLRASLYTHLLYDGFDRCTDRTQRKRLLDETARLAAAVREETAAAGNIFNNLGLLYKAEGDYPRALEYYQKALAIKETVYGAEHPETATGFNNLGAVYLAMGDYPHALEYHQKALEICEKVYGAEHPSTARSYNNLGLVYHAMGDYPRALAYHQRALEICEKVYGAEHPDTATSYNNLGAVYKAMGDYPRALEYLQKALATREKVLGVEHPDTAQSYNNLGTVYHDMGDYPRALDYCQKALAICEKVYGAEHPDTATSYHNLSMLYYKMGEYPTARDYLQKAVAILEKTLGSEHRYTKNSRFGLSMIEKRLAQSK